MDTRSVSRTGQAKEDATKPKEKPAKKGKRDPEYVEMLEEQEEEE